MKFFYALCVLCGLVLPALALDREAFTFTSYDLNVRVEPEQQRLGVRGKITLRNDSDAAQKNAVLQISSTLNWRSIQIEGKSAEFLSQVYTSDIDHTGALSEIIVTLPRPIAPKQTIEIEIAYEGVIPQDASRLMRIGVPAETARHSDWDQIGRWFTGVRGIGYVAWYPMATEAANLSEASSVSEEVGRWKKREAQTEMTVRFSYSGAATGGLPQLFCDGAGQEERQEQLGQAFQVTNGCKFSSLGTTVPLFVIGNYSALDRPAINISYLPERKSGADNYALAVEQVAPFVDRWFGGHRPLPDLKAEVIDLPDADASPFESGSMLLMPLTGNDTTMLLSALRQLTHVAFPSSRPWISDGLALFAQVSYMEREKGRTAALAYLANHRNVLLESERTQAQGESSAAENSLVNSPDEFYVQAKAMNVWWMLRDLAGETEIIAALHNYNAADDKDAYYLQKLIEAQTHRDLGWFFDDWVYRDRGLPDFRIVSVYPRDLVSGGYMVTVTVENAGDAAAEVPVTLKMATGEASAKLVIEGKSSASIRIQAPAIPEEAIVNDGGVPERDTSNNTYRIGSGSENQ